MKLDSSVVAVVTGGASGLGAATARALAAQGVKTPRSMRPSPRLALRTARSASW